MSFCVFSCEEKVCLTGCSVKQEKGKRILKLQTRTNEQLAVWEEGNLGARYWRQLIHLMAAYAKFMSH